jgi:hypothetical protein
MCVVLNWEKFDHDLTRWRFDLPAYGEAGFYMSIVPAQTPDLYMTNKLIN